MRGPHRPAAVDARRSGKVFLVGAGPGDPDLLTVKALRVIEQADLVLCDRLVSEEIRALIPAETPVRCVGKSSGNHSVAQPDLNSMLIEEARRGLRVCRLKGGDPFVFGRGGEEMLSLRQAGVEVEVVPGITAALGASAYAGTPLTHRGLSQAVTLITGHGAQSLDVNWQALAALDHTLVFYMGLGELETIQTQLLANGAGSDTPAALIERATTPDQRTVTGSLDQLSRLARWYQVESPTLIVIGKVVGLTEELHWFGGLLPEQLDEMTA